MMKSAVFAASALVVADAGNIGLTWQDCGSESTHATVLSLTPDSIDVPGKATIVGSGVSDADVTSASFKLKVKKGAMTLVSGKGSICEDTTIKLPFGTGSFTVQGMDCPIPAGDVVVYVYLDILSGPDMFEDGDNSLLSIHIDAKADDTHDQVICIDVDAHAGGPPPSPAPPSPAPSPPSPAPDPPSYSYQTITPSSDTNLCLDLPGGDTSNGNQLWLWECYGGESQRWHADNWQIRYAPDESKCIDAGDMADGSQLYLWDCSGSPQQTWVYDSDASSLSLSESSTCLDFYGDWDSNGQPLHVWDCTGDWNQQWSLWDPSALTIV